MKTNRTWLVPVLGVALLGVGAALWTILHPAQQSEVLPQSEGVIDFAQIIRDLAERRDSGGDRLREDDPIRKEGSVFVRTWRVAAPRREAAQALMSDLIAEASRWSSAYRQLPPVGSDVGRLRVNLREEAFDLHISVRGEREPEADPTPLPLPTPRPEPPPGAAGRLAILLDDAGQNPDLMAAVNDLPKPVGVAVLPFLPVSSESATTLHKAGHEVWLHLPMEPADGAENNPGPGAIFVSMSEAEVRTTVHSAFNNVPHAVGMNNHMGSKATADLRLMTWVMQEIKGRNLAFIDSRTTVRTVAETAARAQGVPTGRRHVFLDNERSEIAIRRQLDEAVYRALMKGECIAIGHFTGVTVRVLTAQAPGLAARGITLVPPSELLR